jgi:predicted ATPase
MAACIGREFSHELLMRWLRSVRTRSGMHSPNCSLRSRSSGAVPPKVGYSFKHALVQNVAHESLLKSRRLQIHARIAAVLEKRFPTVARRSPRRWRSISPRAGLRAVGYWLRAGRGAAEHSAIWRGSASYRKGWRR